MAKHFDSFAGGKPPVPQLPRVALDRFGHPLEEGHLVVYHPPHDNIFEVVSAHPVVHPGVQGGLMMQVTMQAQFNVLVPMASPSANMIICGETRARVEKRAKDNGKVGIGSGASDKPGEEPTRGPGPSQITLTDAPPFPANEPVIPDDAPMGVCDNCGDTGVIDEACHKCGEAPYRKADAE